MQLSKGMFGGSIIGSALLGIGLIGIALGYADGSLLAATGISVLVGVGIWLNRQEKNDL